MSKLKWAILIALCLAAGAALYLFVYPAVATAFPQVQSLGSKLLSFINSIPTHIQNLTAWIQQNWMQAAGITGGAVSATIAVGKVVYERFKGAQEQLTSQKMMEANQKVNEAQTQLLTVTSENQGLKTSNDQLKQEVASLRKANENVANLEKQVETLTAERNQLERVLGDKYFPKEEPPKVK